MADIFFYTDLHLIASVDYTTNPGQPETNAYGHTDAVSGQDRFLVTSVFQSISAVSPKAYAVTDGFVCFHPHPTNTNLVTAILQPFKQPTEFSNINLPKIKYFVYRGILKNSVLNSANTLVADAGNGVDLIDNIWSSHPDSVNSNIAASALSILALDTFGASTLISSSFENIAYQKTTAGESIGKFDPSGFGFEIIFEEKANEPMLSYLEPVDPIKHYVEAPTLTGSGTNYQEFVQRSLREKILEFLDPAAFYGVFYSRFVKAKDSVGVDSKILGGTNDYLELLKKFYNKNIVYVDIRNEFNHSFNYFRFTQDDFFPIYADNLGLELVNVAGANPISAKDYYENRWPILRLNNTPGISSDFPSGNTESINVAKFKFDLGNNLNPIGLLFEGFLFNENIDGSWPENKVKSKERFVELTSNGSGQYDGLNLAFPNHKLTGTTDVVPFYARIMYARRLTENPISPTPANEIQFMDFLFNPLKYKVPGDIGNSELQATIYDSNTYLDLTQNSGDVEVIASTGIASDEFNVTLFARSDFKRKGNSRSVNKALSFSSDSDLGDTTFFEYFDDRYKRGKLAINKVVRTAATDPEIATFDGSSLYRMFHRFDDPATDDFFSLTLTKSHFDLVLTTIEDAHIAGDINKDLGVWITILNRNDRDGDLLTDIDDLHLPKEAHVNENKRYLSFDVVIKGFKDDGASDVEVVILSPGIVAFANVDNTSKIISNLFIDENASIGALPNASVPCNVLWNISDPPRPDDTKLTMAIPGVPFAVPFNTVYKQDLETFIHHLWDAAVNNPSTPTIITHYPSFLLYHNIFSRLILKAPTVYTVGVGSNVINGVSSFNTRRPANPSAIQLNFDPITGEVVPDIPFAHEGFLLEGANHLALYHTTRNLIAFQNKIIEVKFKKSATSSLLYDKVFQNLLLPELSKYTYVYNLMLFLKANGINFPDNPTGDFTHYENYFEIFYRYTSFAKNTVGHPILTESIYDQYLASNGKNLTDCKTFNDIVQSYMDERNFYIVELTKCIYYALGGTGTDIKIYNYGTGDGSETSSIFDIPSYGISLFNYKVEPCTGAGKFVGSESKPIPDNEFDIEVPLNHVPGKNYVVHMGLYGVDGSANTDDSVAAYRGTTYVSGTPGTNDFEFKGVGETYTNDSPASWTDGMSVPAPIGNYLEITKDLIITDNSIDKLKYTIGSLKGEEILRTIIFFRTEYHILNYNKYFQDPFDDDQYMLDDPKIIALWDVNDPNEDANLTALVQFIKGATEIEVSMYGGFIGQEIIPIPYDAAKAPYVVGDRALHNNTIYEVANTNSVEPGTTSDWVELIFNPNEGYGIGDQVKQGTSIWAANTSIPGSGAAFNPSEWDIIFTEHSPITTYNVGDVVLYNNLTYKCISQIGTVGTFNPKDWSQLPVLTSNTCYRFDPANNWLPQGGCLQDTGGVLSPLKVEQYPRLRATFGSISYDNLTNKITIKIESYASPLKSNLHLAMAANGLPVSSVDAMKAHTIYVQDNTATNTLVSGIPSYNQVLTALRCWGLLVGIVGRIKDRGSELNGGADATLNAILDTMLSDADTKVATTEAGVGSSPVIAKHIAFEDFSTKYEY